MLNSLQTVKEAKKISLFYIFELEQVRTESAVSVLLDKNQN